MNKKSYFNCFLGFFGDFAKPFTGSVALNLCNMKNSCLPEVLCRSPFSSKVTSLQLAIFPKIQHITNFPQKFVEISSNFCNSSFQTQRVISSYLIPLSANPTKWSNTLKQLPTKCLSVFDHFVKLALKGLKYILKNFARNKLYIS